MGYREKLLEVGQRCIRAAARMPGAPIDSDLASAFQSDAMWLLGQLGEAGQALIEAGIADDGRTVAERVRALAKMVGADRGKWSSGIPGDHDLTPSEITLAKVLAACIEWGWRWGDPSSALPPRTRPPRPHGRRWQPR